MGTSTELLVPHLGWAYAPIAYVKGSHLGRDEKIVGCPDRGPLRPLQQDGHLNYPHYA